MRYMRSLLVLLIVLWVGAGPLSCAAQESKEPLAPLRVVIDNNYPPYTFLDANGELKGISVDLWRLFEKKTGRPVELKGMPWAEALRTMEEGNADVIDTLFYNPDRARIYDFTKPYARIPVNIFFHRDISGITDAASLQGFVVATKEGDAAVRELKAAGVTDIRLYESYEEIVKAAADGKVSVFVIDRPPALYYLFKLGIRDRFRNSESLYVGEFHRAVHKGDTETFSLLESGFGQITDDEQHRITEKWLGAEQAGFSLQDVLVPLGILFGTGLLLVVWNRSLQLTVRSKTAQIEQNLASLRQNEEHLQAMLQAIPDLYFVLDRQGVFREYHGPQDAPLVAKPEDFIGRNLKDFFTTDLASTFLDAIARLHDSGVMQTIEYSYTFGEVPRHYEARLAAGEEERIVVIVRDITERKESEMVLREMSTHDTLTGLYNRNHFEYCCARMTGEEAETLGVAFCDLDGLKLVNDTLGHDRGDLYLKSVAAHMRNVFPSHAVLARIGGDEFGILLPNIQEAEFTGFVNRLAEGLPTGMEQAIRMPVSISVGAVFRSGEEIRVPDMLLEADRLMYRVKLHRKSSIRHEIIQALRKMLEVRDYITDGHADRMEKLVVRLAERMGMRAEVLPDLRLFAQFHDIGKVGVSDSILFKPGSLTHEEMEAMRRHTEIGYHIALSSLDLVPIADWILKHHERWDGKGYPIGLKHEEIPLECRILAVVDSFDAMTNDRPYSKARSPREALGELRACAGTQFDPLVVNSFVEIMR